MLKGMIPRRHRAGVETRIVGSIEEFRGPICAQNEKKTLHDEKNLFKVVYMYSRNKTLRSPSMSTFSTNTTMKNELPHSLMQATQFIDPTLGSQPSPFLGGDTRLYSGVKEIKWLQS
ncbi:hypothetical protein C8Q74DRAFT_147055 [Fomes fomentarius]|nr:hypothetical protein C8Q74DRAFT_147055 [Fomes fomentarius]